MAEDANQSEVLPVEGANTLDSNKDLLSEKAEVFLCKGNERCREKDFVDAIRLYTEGIEVNCKDDEVKAKLHSNRAKAYFDLGNFISSLDDAKEATELRPSFVKAILNGARASFELKELEETITWCEKGLDIDHENSALSKLKETTISVLSKSQHEAEGKDPSDSSNTRSISEAEPENDANETNLRTIAELFMNEGNDEFRKKEYREACRLYSEGIKVRCRDDELKAKLYSNRAAAHFKLENYHDSLRDARIANELQPSMIKTNVWGARACLQLNRYEEAVTWCDQGLEIDKNNSQLLKVRINCVEEQRRLENQQGENKKQGAFIPQLDSDSIDVQESNSSGKVGGRLPNFKADFEGQEGRLKLAEETGDKVSEELACAKVGNAYQRTGNIKKSLEYHERELKIAKDMKHLEAEGRACCNLGNDYFSLGDFKRAISYHARDLQIAKELGDVKGEGIAYGHLGVNHCSLGYFKRAIDYHYRSLEIATSVGDKRTEGNAYGNLGSCYFSLGDFRKALKYHERSLKMSKDEGDIAGEGSMYCNLGNDYRLLGDVKKATEFHRLFLEISQELGNISDEGSAYCNLGNDHEMLGHVKEALVYHKRHLEIAKQIGDIAGEARAYNNLGVDYLSLGDFKLAKEYLETYLNIAQKMGDLSGEEKALGNLASISNKLGDFKTAVVYLERKLKIAKEAGNLYSEAKAYGVLGSVYRRMGDLKRAIHFHERQLEIAKHTGIAELETEGYGNLGNDHTCLGDFQKAKSFLESGLKIAKDIGDKALEGNLCGNLGNVCHSTGNFRDALLFHEHLLKISNETGNVHSEGISYVNLGNAYHNLGDFRKAIDCHERALGIAKRIGDVPGEGIACGNLGNAYGSLGDFKRAIEYHERDLEIAKKVGDISGEGVSYGNIGSCYHEMGDFQKAVDYYECHLQLAEKAGDKASEGKAYGSLGSAYNSLGDSLKAIKYHERCRQIAEEVGDAAGQGVALGNLGLAHQNRGDFAKAIEFHKRYLEIAKEVGAIENEGKAYSSLGVCYFRQRHFQKAMDCHERHMEIAKQIGDKVGIGIAFFNIGEVYQSQGSLTEAVNCFSQSVTMFNDLTGNLGLHDDWKMSMRNMRHAAYVSLWHSLVEQQKVTEAVVAAEQGRAQALKDLLQLNYSSEAEPVDSGTANECLDDLLSCVPSNTVFMALVKKEVFFWIFQKGKEVQLRRKEIEDWDQDISTFFESLMSTTWCEIDVRAAVKCEDRSLDVKRDDNFRNENEKTPNQSHSFQKSALAILHDIIISPIEDTLDGNEVIFIPEGPLCLAPFAAFMNSDSKYLSEFFRLRVIPSLTSLKLIADCPTDYHLKTGALLVGDPWVQEVDYQGIKLEQLPCAVEEVQMIGKVLNTVPLTGQQATKDEVLKRLSSVALVHIAAHGKMSTGEIALAPNIGRKSKVPLDEDFILTMTDVLNVRMRAQLVVLSCCHSARGNIKAEGVVGIARAFLGAGARSVLVSLWAIDDKATLEFMKIFYQRLVSGKSASESLKETMNCMRQSGQFNEVKNWAPFVLIGDDVTLEFGGPD
ncbi:uncharacterized protein LOC141891899 isoform X1 [Acropora palmata]|uniref:uncharacterized protein LOC141891899 isoform X1 n=2 Tax=Acropora palmata TaxID=6131 RepID=UPI003DA0E5F4